MVGGSIFERRVVERHRSASLFRHGSMYNPRMKKLLPMLLLAVCFNLSVQAADQPAAAKTLATDQDKTLYALGALLSRSVKTFQLTPAEFVHVQRGFADGVLGHKLLLDAEAQAPQVQKLHDTRMQAAAAKAEIAGAAFIASAAKQPGATRTASGIVMTTLTAGQGATPAATDKVKVHYEGRLIDGTVFDSSRQRNEPAEFPLDGVIPCWTEAVQLMKVGGRARIVCPAKLAYGERGSPPLILPGSTLVFDVELLDIVK